MRSACPNYSVEVAFGRARRDAPRISCLTFRRESIVPYNNEVKREIKPLSLPKSVAVLSSMIQEAKEVVAVVKQRVLANSGVLSALTKEVQSEEARSNQLLRIKDLLTQVQQLNAFPSMSSLSFYMGVDAEERWLEGVRCAVAMLPKKEKILSGQGWLDVQGGLDLWIDADTAFIVALNDFITRIHSELATVENGSRPESSAESKEKKPLPIPKNKMVVELARRLALSQNRKRTKLDVALELTDGDETMVHNILRQLRSRPELHRD